MELTEIMKILSGPLVGAAIGYFTNMIAVKMLFYPRREIRLFGRRLPLTPGVIPKGRPRLASSVGEVIEKHLLTGEDITAHLLSEQAKKTAADAVMEKLAGNIRQEIMQFTALDDAAYDEKKAALCRALSAEIIRAIQSSDATDAILTAFAEAVKGKFSSSPMKLLVNDRTLQTVMQPAKEMLDNMLDQNGTEYIQPILQSKLSEAEENSGLALLAGFEVSEETVRAAVTDAYGRIVEQCAEAVLQSVNISQLAQDKINAMPIEELERLVQDVMKKELNAIINLGALIGFILGLINMFF